MNSQIDMKFESLHKKSPFTVPDGYFESFPDKVMMQINNLPEQHEPTTPRLIFKRQFSIAAAFIGFFLISYTFFTLISRHQDSRKMAENTTYEEAVLQYVNEKDLMETMIAEEQPMNPEQVEDYLINENIHESVVSDYFNQ